MKIDVVHRYILISYKSGLRLDTQSRDKASLYHSNYVTVTTIYEIKVDDEFSIIKYCKVLF